MARRLRLEFPGGLYHVFSRGNCKNSIFIDDSDRRMFLSILARTITMYNWICHAFCLMGNHYHLIIETPDGNLSIGMKYLNGVYTQKFNYLHKKSGHVFQGRFNSKLIDKQNYLITLSAYVVTNPVKEGFVPLPEEWPWSSYAPTMGLRPKPHFLTCDFILGEFGTSIQTARAGYMRFVRAITKNDLGIDDLAKGSLIGSTEFMMKYGPILDGNESIKEIQSNERLSNRPTLDALFKGITKKAPRNEKISEAFLSHGYKMIEIARFLNLDHTTICKVINKAKKADGVRS